MADGLAREEIDAFRQWVRDTYGAFEIFSIGTITEDPKYKHWVSVGRPGFRGVEVPTTPTLGLRELGPEVPEGFLTPAEEQASEDELLRLQNEVRTSLGLTPKELEDTDTVESLTQDLRSIRLTADEFALSRRGAEEGIQLGREQLTETRRQFDISQAAGERQTEIERLLARGRTVEGFRQQLRQATLQRQAFMPQGVFEGDIAERIRKQFEKKFDDYIGSISSSPRNFFQSQILRQASNPFTRDDPNIIEEARFNIERRNDEIALQDERLKTVSDLRKDILAQMKDSDNPLTKESVANPSTAAEYRAANILNIWQEATDEKTRLQELNVEDEESFASGEAGEAARRGARRAIETVPIREAPFTGGGGTVGRVIGHETVGFSVGEESEPRVERDLRLDIPEALRPFVSGGAAKLSREDLFARDIVTPSAQQFNRLTSTSLAQLGGLFELRGENFQDLLGGIEKSLPERLSLRRTARPARQI